MSYFHHRNRLTGQPFYVSSSTKSESTNVTSITIDLPANVRNGDLLVSVVFGRETRTWTEPSGWTLRAQSTTARPTIGIATKVATDESGSITWNYSSSNRMFGVIMCFRKASFGVTGAFGSGSNPVVAPSIDTNASGLLIGAFSREIGSTTGTTPADMTVIVTDDDASDPSCLIATQRLFSKTTTGTKSSTFGSGGQVNTQAVLFSLK